MILNSIADIKKYFASGDKPMTSAEFLEEWNALTDEDKKWFKEQDLTTE